MKLRMCHLAVGLLSLFLIHGVAQDVRPLPSANNELVTHFQLALDAVLGVGIRLQAFLAEDQNENFLVSPISAAVIIGQLMLGAEGEFRKQLVELLSLPNSHKYENDKILVYIKNKNMTFDLPYSTFHLQMSHLLKNLTTGKHKRHFILKQKSIIFVNNQITLKKDFLRNMKNLYSARPYELDFARDPVGSQKYINSWGANSTNGLIKTILVQPPLPTTASIFANAVYFLAEWEIPFSDVLNRVGPFTVSSTKQVKLTYMIGLLEEILYSESETYRMIALPYKNEELAMYILLPRPKNEHKLDIKTFIQNVKTSEILETIAKARRRDVVVKIPKMSVSSSFSILEELKKYRVYKKQNVQPNVTSGNVVDKIEDKVDAFTNFTTDDEKDVYLTNAAVGRSLRIDDIVQQVIVTVNEKGTEAAAISASTIDYIGGQKNFIIDRPFVFFIRHEATSATLFWGTISNPLS